MENHSKIKKLDDIYDINFENLIIWSIRSFCSKRNCIGLGQTLYDWFGNYSEDLIHNTQILVWANHSNIGCNKFMPFSSNVLRQEEILVLNAIEAINQNDEEKAVIISKNLAGDFFNFALISLKNIAHIVKFTQNSIA